MDENLFDDDEDSNDFFFPVVKSTGSKHKVKIEEYDVFGLITNGDIFREESDFKTPPIVKTKKFGLFDDHDNDDDTIEQHIPPVKKKPKKQCDKIGLYSKAEVGLRDGFKEFCVHSGWENGELFGIFGSNTRFCSALNACYKPEAKSEFQVTHLQSAPPAIFRAVVDDHSIFGPFKTYRVGMDCIIKSFRIDQEHLTCTHEFHLNELRLNEIHRLDRALTHSGREEDIAIQFLPQPKFVKDIFNETLQTIDDIFQIDYISYLIMNFVWDYPLTALIPIQIHIQTVRNFHSYLEMETHIYDMNRVNLKEFLEKSNERRQKQDEIDEASLENVTLEEFQRHYEDPERLWDFRSECVLLKNSH